MDRPPPGIDEQLHARLERLARDELDLHERIGYRVAELKGNGLLVRDDPACQGLSDELRRVRKALDEARNAFLGVSAPPASAISLGHDSRSDTLMHYNYPIEILSRGTQTRFQLGFARQTARCMPPFKDVAFEPTSAGLLILGADELALSMPIEALRQIHGAEVAIGDPRVRYFFDGVFHEPIMWVRISITPRWVEQVTSDLIERGAGVDEIDRALARPVVKARAPLRLLLGYPKTIATLTGNTADLLMWVSHYEPMPPQPPVSGRAA